MIYLLFGDDASAFALRTFIKVVFIQDTSEITRVETLATTYIVSCAIDSTRCLYAV
jgi:hypothetical protein